MNASTEPIRLAPSQKDRAAEALTKAFHDDPAYMKLFPDPAERDRALLRLWQGVVKYCLAYGEVYTTPAVEGAACWLSPGNTEVTLWRSLRVGLPLQRTVMRFRPEARRPLLDMIAYLEKNHKRLVHGPHWHLWVLGVEPARQGKGIGGKLIEPVLTQSEEVGIPCYLEAMTEGNVAFYQKRGFTLADEGEAPGLGLKVWMMLREPRR